MAQNRILIADADDKAAAGLREALGDAWIVVGATTGSAAQDEAQKAAFEVVIANSDLPDISGAELLNRLRSSHPKTLRFIAAAENLREKVMSQVLRGDNFLALPFDKETLKASIERSLAADYGMNNSLRELVGRIRTFPTIPSLYLEVANALKDPNTTTDEIGGIIAKDMAMTTKLVQVLNSAYFGLPRTITDPTEAVGILGFETVKSLIMTVKLLSQYDKVKPAYFSIDSIWRHSTNVARTARVMALLETGDNETSGIAYTAGLMHDLGKVILATNFDEQYHGAHNVARKQQIPLWEVEKDIFGATHGEIGAYLLGLWGMSPEVVKVAAMHHHPQRAGDKEFTALTAVHVANAFEYEGVPDPDGLPPASVDVEYLKQLGLEARVDLWRAARRDPEESAVESRAQRAKAKRAADAAAATTEGKAPRKGKRNLDGTAFETRAQRARTAAKAALAKSSSTPAKPVEVATPAPAPVVVPAPQAAPNVVPLPVQPASSNGLWKWGGIGLAAAAAIVLIARVAFSSSPSPSADSQKVAVNTAPAKDDAPVVTSAKPVEEPKTTPAPAPEIAALQQPAIPTPPPAKPAAPVKTALDKLKLQAIFYSDHPSALINGQMAGVNEEVADCRVLEINQSSVTLQYLDQRKTLTLR